MNRQTFLSSYKLSNSGSLATERATRQGLLRGLLRGSLLNGIKSGNSYGTIKDAIMVAYSDFGKSFTHANDKEVLDEVIAELNQTFYKKDTNSIILGEIQAELKNQNELDQAVVEQFARSFKFIFSEEEGGD